MAHDQSTALAPSALTSSAPALSTPGLSRKQRKQRKQLEKLRRTQMMEAFRDPTSETPKYFVPSLPPRGCVLPGVVTGGAAPEELWAQPLPGLSSFWRERLGEGFFAALEVATIEHASPRAEHEAFVHWVSRANRPYARAGVALSLLAGWWRSSPGDFDLALRALAASTHGSDKPLAPYLSPAYPSEDFDPPSSDLAADYVARCAEVGCGLTDLEYGASSLVTAAWFDPASRRLLHARIEGQVDDVELDHFGEIGDCCGGPQFADLIGSMASLNSLEIMSLSPDGGCGVIFSWSSPPRTLEISNRDAAEWLFEAERRLPAELAGLSGKAPSGRVSGLRFS